MITRCAVFLLCLFSMFTVVVGTKCERGGPGGDPRKAVIKHTMLQVHTASGARPGDALQRQHVAVFGDHRVLLIGIAGGAHQFLLKAQTRNRPLGYRETNWQERPPSWSKELK